jgi:hypothetical protein
MAFRLDIPNVDDTNALADWIEISILRRARAQLSRARVIEWLGASLDASAKELDLPISWAFKEIARRRRIVGGAYPLTVEETQIRLTVTHASAFYVFLLLVSLDGPMRRARRFNEIDRIFDRVVQEAVRSYLGPKTNTLRFGWPPSEGRPASFRNALDWLSERIGLPIGPGHSAPNTKDGGLDVVAWKPFNDKRSAFALALVQCTVQSDWHPKAKDLLDHVWMGRIDSGRPVMLSLAIPFVIPKNYAKWDDLRRMTSVVFDRLRLAEVLSEQDTLRFGEMLAWSKHELHKLAVEGD